MRRWKTAIKTLVSGFSLPVASFSYPSRKKSLILRLTDMPLKLKETNISNEHNRLKNPYWREADQLAIYKHDRGVELGSTEKQLQFSGQSGT